MNARIFVLVSWRAFGCARHVLLFLHVKGHAFSIVWYVCADMHFYAYTISCWNICIYSLDPNPRTHTLSHTNTRV